MHVHTWLNTLFHVDTRLHWRGWRHVHPQKTTRSEVGRRAVPTLHWETLSDNLPNASTVHTLQQSGRAVVRCLLSPSRCVTGDSRFPRLCLFLPDTAKC